MRREPEVRPAEGDDGHETSAGGAGEGRRPSLPSAPRRPQQERGQRRVDTILDGAAALIEEEGVAAVTMHRVARHSGTTTGSMYHFFPDREALLRALAARHAQAIRSLMGKLERDAATRWAGMATPAAVDLFLDPLLDYMEHHPDLLPLARLARTAQWGAARDAELDAVVVRVAEALVASRDPSTPRAALAVRAVAVLSMLEGIVGAMGRTMPGRTTSAATRRRALRAELRRALVLYLDSYASR